MKPYNPFNKETLVFPKVSNVLYIVIVILAVAFISYGIYKNNKHQEKEVPAVVYPSTQDNNFNLIDTIDTTLHEKELTQYRLKVV